MLPSRMTTFPDFGVEERLWLIDTVESAVLLAWLVPIMVLFLATTEYGGLKNERGRTVRISKLWNISASEIISSIAQIWKTRLIIVTITFALELDQQAGRDFSQECPLHCLIGKARVSKISRAEVHINQVIPWNKAWNYLQRHVFNWFGIYKEVWFYWTREHFQTYLFPSSFLSSRWI